MTEKWAVPFPKKRVEQPQHQATEQEQHGESKKVKAEDSAASADLPQFPDPDALDDRLSGDYGHDVPRLEAYLKDIGQLDPTLGVHEHLQSRDPMLIVLECPAKRVIRGDGAESTFMDEMIRSADKAIRRSCGSRYADFAMIQDTVQNTLRSNNLQAKQILFLGMMAFDRGLHEQFLASYPAQTGVIKESARFEPYMKRLKTWLDGMLNTMYVSVPAPTRYNVEGLAPHFLTKCVTRYPG